MSEDPADDGGPSDADEDPFGCLGIDDRDGDPFERLGDVEEPDAGDVEDSEYDAPTDPWGPPGEDRRDGRSADDRDDSTAGERSVDESATNDEAAPDGVDATRTDPFADVDTPAENPFDGGGGSVFERADAGIADPDQVWADVTGERDDDEDEGPRVPDDSRYSEVSKHRFCERCEFFSGPPDVSCNHEAAEIVEFLDMETVRLRQCPIVAEREALERGE